MTPLPSLADVIRETLTEQFIMELVRQSDAYFRNRLGPTPEALADARRVLLSALLLPLSAREQALREERDKAVSALARVQSAAKTIVAGADRRVLSATAHEPAARAAIATLDSERAMNATLTSELEGAEARVLALTAERDAARGCPHGDDCACAIGTRHFWLEAYSRGAKKVHALTVERDALKAALFAAGEPPISSPEIGTALGATPDEKATRFTSGVQKARAKAARRKCSHKFVDSNRCLKCGWAPTDA